MKYMNYVVKLKDVVKTNFRNICSGSHKGTSEGTLSGQPRSSRSETSSESGAWAQLQCLYGIGVRCSCANPRPMCRDGDLIPFSMTLGLLPF